MESEETPHHHHGGIYNYFQGATIHNLVINGNMNKNGNDYYQEEHCQEKHKYNDEQIAQAITAINGVKKTRNWEKLHCQGLTYSEPLPNRYQNITISIPTYRGVFLSLLLHCLDKITLTI